MNYPCKSILFETQVTGGDWQENTHKATGDTPKHPTASVLLVSLLAGEDATYSDLESLPTHRSAGASPKFENGPPLDMSSAKNGRVCPTIPQNSARSPRIIETVQQPKLLTTEDGTCQNMGSSSPGGDFCSGRTNPMSCQKNPTSVQEYTHSNGHRRAPPQRGVPAAATPSTGAPSSLSGSEVSPRDVGIKN